MTEGFTLTSNHRKKLKELKILGIQKKEAKRIANYMRPSTPPAKFAFDKSQQEAQSRLQGVVYSLMDRYATSHKIDIGDLQIKIAEDPTLLENFYSEAVELIPDHYLPINLDNSVKKLEYYPMRNATGKGIPYRKPVKEKEAA